MTTMQTCNMDERTNEEKLRDSVRRKFEAWCKKEGLPVTIWGGMYKDDRTFAAYSAWKDAIAGVVVELPCWFRDMEPEDIYELEQCIKASGGKIKQ